MLTSLKISIALFTAMSLSVVAPKTEGAIRVPGDQPTIQAGIDVATAGDTVLVAPGTYTGDGNRDLDFGGRDIVVASEDGGLSTIIDCEGTTVDRHRGFHFHSGESAAAVVDGFTILNGVGRFNGGAILCDQFSSPTIANCIIRDCQANGGTGGGITCSNLSSPTLVGCVISGCSTNNEGGGIDILFNSSPTIDQCVFYDNRGDGGAAHVGVVPTDVSAPTFTDCVFEGNETLVGRYRGGAVVVAGGATASFTNCLFANNYATGFEGSGGGGIWVTEGATVTVLNSTIAGNRTGEESGGGILITGSSANLNLENTILWGNCATGDGDELHQDGGPATVNVTCCCVNDAGVTGPVNYIGDQVFENPSFCGPALCDESPTTGGDYTLAVDSPCLAANNSCGVLIGKFDAACPPHAVDSATWGGIKAAFR